MSTLPTIDTTTISAFGSLAALVASAVGAYAIKLINRHVSAKNLALSESIISKSVKAAQQLGAGKLVGSAKFQLAEKFAITELARVGITLTPEEIQAGIEAAVTDLKAVGVAVVNNTPPAAPTAAQTQAAAAAALRAVADQIDGVGTPPSPSGPVDVAPVPDAPAAAPAS